MSTASWRRNLKGLEILGTTNTSGTHLLGLGLRLALVADAVGHAHVCAGLAGDVRHLPPQNKPVDVEALAAEARLAVVHAELGDDRRHELVNFAFLYRLHSTAPDVPVASVKSGVDSLPCV